MFNNTPRKPTESGTAGLGVPTAMMEHTSGATVADLPEQLTTVSLHNEHSTSSTGVTRVAEDSKQQPRSIFQETYLTEEDHEREQRLLYLRQAFCRFFKAKAGVEMENLGRVICAILGLSDDEHTMVMDSISKIAPAVVVSSTFDSINSVFDNLFS